MTIPADLVSSICLTKHSPNNPVQRKSSLHRTVLRLAAQNVNLWRQMPGTFFPFGTQFSLEEQKKNEQTVDRDWRDSLERGAIPSRNVRIHRARLQATVQSIVLMVDQEHREGIAGMLDGCFQVSEEFVRQANEMDPDLRPEEIHQAIRNLWIVNSMQWAFGLPLRLTPSALAYSLLYPYTDNYLDNPCVADGEKAEFGRVLRRRLSGFSARSSPLFSRISGLVDLIEGEFPRTVYPGVYESLLAIHGAQEESLGQKAASGILSETDVLRISVMKGGTSVLADAFLAKGTVTGEEMQFSFGYGVVLQFLDDLQDIEGDRGEGSSTLFTRAEGKWALEATVNRLIRFTSSVLGDSRLPERSRAEGLSQLIERSCYGLLLESVAGHQEKFTRDYCKALEQYSPLRFGFFQSLRDRRQDLERRWNSTIGSTDILPD